MNGNQACASKTVRITLKVFGGLRALRPPGIEKRDLPEGSTLDTLWRAVERETPEFVARLRDGVADGYLHVLCNGRNTVFLGGSRTRLHDGDVVTILPPVGGG